MKFKVTETISEEAGYDFGGGSWVHYVDTLSRAHDKATEIKRRIPEAVVKIERKVKPLEPGQPDRWVAVFQR